jgi:hypothetical protein
MVFSPARRDRYRARNQKSGFSESMNGDALDHGSQSWVIGFAQNGLTVHLRCFHALANLDNTSNGRSASRRGRGIRSQSLTVILALGDPQSFPAITMILPYRARAISGARNAACEERSDEENVAIGRLPVMMY